jgi:hypothetical protein
MLSPPDPRFAAAGVNPAFAQLAGSDSNRDAVNPTRYGNATPLKASAS